VEIAPYVVTKNVQRTLANSAFGREQQATMGGDLKFGITPNVTLDATVNPDFSQVESDAFQVQINQRYPIFY